MKLGIFIILGHLLVVVVQNNGAEDCTCAKAIIIYAFCQQEGTASNSTYLYLRTVHGQKPCCDKPINKNLQLVFS